MANVIHETEGVSDVYMTEDRDIPDHPYMREMLAFKNSPSNLRKHMQVNYTFYYVFLVMSQLNVFSNNSLFAMFVGL